MSPFWFETHGAVDIRLSRNLTEDEVAPFLESARSAGALVVPAVADTTDAAYIRKITAAHKAGKPAIVIHCAMHSYRAATIDDWREFLGVTSRRHDHQSRYPVRAVQAGHPALQGFPAVWTSPMDELYIIEKLWPRTTVLADSVSEKDGSVQPAVWVNDYHGTRVFGTTFGHSNATWQDPVFIAQTIRMYDEFADQGEDLQNQVKAMTSRGAVFRLTGVAFGSSTK